MSTTGSARKQAPLPARSWVQKTPGVCGGDACIRDTRITVWGLVNYRRLGLIDARLLEVIDGLTQADLDAAWDYYNRNRDEIDQAIKDNEEA
jgi:uncharacterized protein (DUF433 family)